MSTQQFMDLMQRVRQLELDVSRGSRTIRDGAIPVSRSGTGTGDEETTGTCCCDELYCIKVPGLTEEENDNVKPLFYSFTMPAFDCGCENQAESKEIRLYQADIADDTIWESDVIRCLVPKGLTIPCTVRTTWAWNNAAADWDFVSNDASGCGCTPAKPTFSGTTNGQLAFTTCETTKEADGTSDMGDFIWRLTIIETLDYYGCDPTKVEFILL